MKSHVPFLGSQDWHWLLVKPPQFLGSQTLLQYEELFVVSIKRKKENKDSKLTR